MELKQCILTKNDCYKTNKKMTPKGIVVHSTGANNPNLKRYVQPDDGILGYNSNKNHWNKSGLAKCVHAFIGLDKNGVVRCYQTLPFNICCWGVGNGSKGSYNYNPAYIQFEICEDDLTNKDYFTKAFDLAAEFCAYLIKEYNLELENVVSHHEAHLKGYGCNHADCDHWLKKFGKDMDWFRELVKNKMNEQPTELVEPIEWTKGTYRLTVAKAIRRNHNLGNNIIKVKECTASTKKVLTSTNPNADAKIKVGTDVIISSVYNENGRIWGAFGNCWIVICNIDGTPQAIKLN